MRLLRAAKAESPIQRSRRLRFFMPTWYAERTIAGMLIFFRPFRHRRRCWAMWRDRRICCRVRKISTSIFDSCASMWLKCLACFDQCFEAGEDAWPAIGARGVRSIVFCPLVMGDRDLGGFTLRHKFYRDTGGLARRAERECVLQKVWRLRPEHLATNVGNALAVCPSTYPVHRTTGL